jgi:UPF0755 protein
LRRRALIGVAFIVTLVIAGLAASIMRLQSELETPYYGAPDRETFIEIRRGTNTTEIARLLESSGILRSRLPFLLYLRYKGMGRRIQAGEYQFTRPATPRQIAQRLVRGDVYFQSITVPEGLTARETIDLLARNGLGNYSEMQQLLTRTDWIRDLDPAAQNLEGYLFPETYRFGRDAGSEEILRAMVDQFKKRLAKILEAYPLQAGWNVRKVVILASMIEKEVKKVEEGPLVASVLINRLERKIPLSCDATILYAMKIAGTYDGNLSKSDLKMESPYNTYLHRNLPPGPITNPGADSLRSALNPAKTDYIYYVSRNDGTHHFSRDLRSHTRAVNKYQKSLSRGNRRTN